MKFVNLNDSKDIVSFEEALNRGIGQGGSLYVPQTIPQLSAAEISRLIGANRQEVASIVLTPWLAAEIPELDLKAIIDRASTFDTPLAAVGNKKVLEMFHGP